MIRGSTCPLSVKSSCPLARSQILTRLLPNRPAAIWRLSGEKVTTLALCSGSTATGSSFGTFCGLMRTRFVGRNGARVLVGALVWVAAMGLADGRPVGRGVAIRVGIGVRMGEVGAGLAFVMGDEVVLCTPGGVFTVSLATLQAWLVRMAPKRKTESSMRLFFIDASL